MKTLIKEKKSFRERDNRLKYLRKASFLASQIKKMWMDNLKIKQYERINVIWDQLKIIIKNKIKREKLPLFGKYFGGVELRKEKGQPKYVERLLHSALPTRV